MIYHITTREAWRQALNEGVYRADSLETEGFIHCSTGAQVIQTANRFYAGRPDLVLLAIDESKLDAELIYEESEPGRHFPHLYGSLNLDSVTRAAPFPPGPDGLFSLPDALAS